MPPRENPSNDQQPGVNRPPVRRGESVDGLSPRSIQRPAPLRNLPDRPVFNRPVAPAPIAANSAANGDLPTSQPASPAVTAVENEVPLALAGPTPLAPASPTAISSPLTFDPPKPATVADAETKLKKRRLPKIVWRKLLQRKVLIPLGALASVALIVWAIFTVVGYLQTKASPDTIYRDALVNALSTKQVQIDQQGSHQQGTTQLDLTQLTKPRISSQISTTIGGSKYGLKGYGTASDTFIAYSSLPSGLPPTTSSAVGNQWVQLRKSGVLPAGISGALVTASDPRSQAFGPVLFANLSPKASQTTASFLVDHKVYGYKILAVKHQELRGVKALVYSGKLDNDYLKIANRSVATSEGFTVVEAQNVVDSLTVYKDAKSTLYVDPGKRQVMRLVLTTSDGQSTTYDYSKFDDLKLPSQPNATISWPSFASTQLQVEAQASALLPASERDAIRQSNLKIIQKQITTYYAKSGSYPSLANINNQTWIATNMPSFDPDLTRDPDASSLALLASAPAPGQASKIKSKTVVVATPIIGYIYQPTTAAGKACANEQGTITDQLCTNYSLLATLSTGQAFTLKVPPS